jgi:hypothetical protein
MGSVVGNIPNVFGRGASGGDSEGIRQRSNVGATKSNAQKQSSSGGSKKFDALD